MASENRDESTSVWGARVAVMLTVILAMPVVVAQQPLTAVESSSDGQVFQVRYTADFSEDALTFAELLGYDLVGLGDTDWLEEIGKPMLPVQTVRIALPAGMAVTGVRVANAEVIELSGRYAILPAQAPKPTSEPYSDLDFVAPDSAIYATAVSYPGKLVEFEHQTDLAGQSMAVIRLYPVQYRPAEGRLTLHTSIEIVLDGVDGYQCGDYLPLRLSDAVRATYDRMASEMVVNPADVELRRSESAPIQTRGVDPGTYDYVIILDEDWVGYFQELADWRTKRGTPAQMVTLTWILSEYSGADDQEKIRNFIIDAHSTWGASYFLLTGEDETLPFEYRTYYDGASTPSDEYYSDYDDDWTLEVFVGRLSVGGQNQIDRVVDKILTYETNPPMSNYCREALLLGMDLDTWTHGEDLKEMIDGYIDPGFTVTKVYDSDPTNHKTDTINALNAGQNLFNHDDHCNTGSMGTGVENHGGSSLSIADVNDLINDGEMTVIVSTGCHPNHMDYSPMDCISEYFVLQNTDQAAVAFTGNTRNGWYYQGDPDSLSSELDKDWWYGLFNENKYILGETLVYAKHNFSHSNSIRRHCEWTFNLLGDPLLHIWKDDPETFTVTHDSTLPIGSSSFNVHVADGGGNVNAATVCLWKGDEVYLVDTTNTSGYAYFTPAPTTTGTMYVTVTKQDYLPYEGTATVESAQYTLTISTVGNGSVTKDPDQATYSYGQDVDLTAIADLGWTFDQWSGDLTGSTNPDTITITGNMSVTATFTEDQYTLTISTVGNGSVAKVPDQATYTYGQIVELTANADAGWDFDYWSGALSGSVNPEYLTITGNASVTAHFVEEGCPEPGTDPPGVFDYCWTDIYPSPVGDCIVNLSDLGSLLPNYGGTATPYTFHQGDVYPVAAGDGIVNLSDLGQLLAQYGDNCN